MLAEPVSQYVLNTVSDDVLLKVNVWWRNKNSFKNDTEKVVLLQVKVIINSIIVKSKAEKVLCTFVSCTKHPIEGHEILCTKIVIA